MLINPQGFQHGVFVLRIALVEGGGPPIDRLENFLAVAPAQFDPKGTQPDYLYQPYASTQKRAPTRPLVLLPHTLSEMTGPVFGFDAVAEGENDLTTRHDAAPLGERIIVGGQVLDEGGHPLLVVGEAGRGRSAAWTTDIGPHWLPNEFLRWDGFRTLWCNLIGWTCAGGGR